MQLLDTPVQMPGDINQQKRLVSNRKKHGSVTYRPDKEIMTPTDDWLTNRQTDMVGDREVTLPIMI